MDLRSYLVVAVVVKFLLVSLFLLGGSALLRRFKKTRDTDRAVGIPACLGIAFGLWNGTPLLQLSGTYVICFAAVASFWTLRDKRKGRLVESTARRAEPVKTPAAELSAPGADCEKWYATSIRLYELQKEDMQPLATIAAYAWKHLGNTPKRAVEFAMQTIYLTRHGSPQQKKDAETKWQAAVKWSVDNGLDGIQWGLEVVSLTRAGKG